MYKYYKLALHTMESFINYSEKVGNNFLLCQGPGGNTSIKIENKVLIKKSGYLLSDSKKKNIFKKVTLEDIKSFYENISYEKKFDRSLSIETPLHVLLDSKYIFHYHSIASILISALYKKNTLDTELIKNKILPIKYIRPGVDLANEIIKSNKNYDFKSFFLYNHGVVIENDNVTNLYKSILSTENIFSELIDYKKLKIVAREVLKLKIENNKIKNLFPDIEYKNFKNKYLFPDHPVFFPDSFEYDDEHIYLNKKLNSVESIYFKTLLVLYVLIGNNKVENYIKKDTGRQLRSSKDEQLRIRINK
tara:strand:+ start:313 stop:1227 length:915 start_codon:yes stop_codon:yes gene_type:complete